MGNMQKALAGMHELTYPASTVTTTHVTAQSGCFNVASGAVVDLLHQPRVDTQTSTHAGN